MDEGFERVNMINYPFIEVSFIIEGKDLDLKRLTEDLDIIPNETRDIDDWPDIIKDNPNLPEELQPRYSWCICQEESPCMQIEVPIKEIIAKIKGKEQKILEFCQKSNLRKSLCITIHAKAMCMPEMVLSSDIVSYFGSLDVGIGFDIYTY